LNADIDKILADEDSGQFVRRAKMCKTLSGNNLY